MANILIKTRNVIQACKAIKTRCEERRHKLDEANKKRTVSVGYGGRFGNGDVYIFANISGIEKKADLLQKLAQFSEDCGISKISINQQDFELIGGYLNIEKGENNERTD